MSKKFYRKFMHSKNFVEWLKCLKSFDYELIKANNLQRWTIQDYKNYWEKRKEAI